MKKRKILLLLITMAAMSLLLSGCQRDGKDSSDSSKKSDHPVITMNATCQNMSAFYKLVHERYPEINLEIEPYNGQNLEAYTAALRKSDELPDIYFTPNYVAERQLNENLFIDLSGYAFTGNFVQSKLREVTYNGKTLMLPLSYNAFGITYNKTLLEENGWELPKTLDEAEELKKKVEAAGYIFCRDQIQNPESGFQYICNIADTAFLSTIDGLVWQNSFLSGEATVEGTPEMKKALQLLDRWRDIGFLNGEGTPNDDAATRRQLLEGKTLFLIGDSSNLNVDNQSEYEFRLMPYISEDGTRNVFILKTSSYVGLNKKLEEKGNEVKLEDALHIMELLSTQEGIEALTPGQNDSRLIPLNNAVISENNYYKNVIEDLNNGYTANYIHAGWENIIDFLGGKAIEYICGEATVDDIISGFDNNQFFIVDGISFFYTQANETLSTEECARLVGICFAQAVGAEAALISTNSWKYDTGIYQLNTDGVSGKLYPGSISDQEITSILPTGWKGNIMTVTLTGKRIKELAAEGYDFNNNGDTFPYVLVTKGDMELDDETVYTIPICGATDSVKKEGSIKDSGILGLKVAQDYFFGIGPQFGAADITWK